MDTQSKKCDRRVLKLIDAPFQTRIIVSLVFTAVGASGVYFAAFSALFWWFRRKALALQIGPNDPFFALLSEQQRMMNAFALATTLLLAILIGLHGLHLSHRIAGPIYRLRRYLSAGTQGEPLKPFALRKGDFFSDLPKDVNAFIEARVENCDSPDASGRTLCERT